MDPAVPFTSERASPGVTLRHSVHLSFLAHLQNPLGVLFTLSGSHISFLVPFIYEKRNAPQKSKPGLFLKSNSVRERQQMNNLRALHCFQAGLKQHFIRPNWNYSITDSKNPSLGPVVKRAAYCTTSLPEIGREHFQHHLPHPLTTCQVL